MKGLFFTHIMANFKKHYNLKIIPISISVLLLLNTNAYPLTIPSDNNTTLRSNLMTDTINREQEIKRLKFVTELKSFEKELEIKARELGYTVNDETKFVLLLGENLSTSSYYKLFTHGFHAAGLNIVYLSYETPPSGLEQKNEFSQKQ